MTTAYVTAVKILTQHRSINNESRLGLYEKPRIAACHKWISSSVRSMKHKDYVSKL
jgi:hypothetical protein